MRGPVFVAVALVLGRSAAFGQSTAPACFNPDSAWPHARTFAVAPRCVSLWIDSLRATRNDTQEIAAMLLSIVGGRTAVDGLRAEYERTKSSRLARPLVGAMSTTGSHDDIAFLVGQLARTDTDARLMIQAASTALGLAREESAREPLRAIVARSAPDRSEGRAAAAALEALDRPPCADTVGADLPRDLVRIVIQCRPLFLNRSSQYRDESTGRVWQFTGDAWTDRPIAPADSTRPRLGTQIRVVPEAGMAFIQMGMYCGSLCGERWTFRLRREGRVWRVIGAEFNAVS